MVPSLAVREVTAPITSALTVLTPAPKFSPMAKSFHEWTEAPPPLTLKILCQDPYVMETQGLGLVTVTLEPERYLQEGPTTTRVAVVDYNVDLDEVFTPVQVRKDGHGFAVGPLGPNLRSNFQFHQVNVWAIVNRTIGLLEDPQLLGRPIPWASGLGRLIVLPHAGYGRNAFYDRATGALHFLYFEGRREQEPVFTCLSHDIVTHELGHAVLDGLKPYYNEVSSVEAAGFHEYFGDALALASSLTFRDVLAKAVGAAPLQLSKEFIGKLAQEFGSAQGPESGYLRAAFEPRTMKELEGTQEEHDYSQVLTNAFYTFLAWLYEERVKRTPPRPGKTALDGGQTVAALVNAANQASRTFFRALDYCPPVDISYLDYARAVIRADQVAYPNDDDTREQIGKIFVERGIIADGKDLTSGPRLRNADLHPYDVDKLSATPSNAHRFVDANRRALRISRNANFSILKLYRTAKEGAHRYYPPQEVIVEFTWTEDVLLRSTSLDLGRLANTRLPLYCGGTIVFDRNGNVLHYVLRDGSEARRMKLIEYVAYLVSRGRIGVAEQGLGANAKGVHQIVVHTDGTRARLERDPMLRHEGRRRARG